MKIHIPTSINIRFILGETERWLLEVKSPQPERCKLILLIFYLSVKHLFERMAHAILSQHKLLGKILLCKLLFLFWTLLILDLLPHSTEAICLYKLTFSDIKNIKKETQTFWNCNNWNKSKLFCNFLSYKSVSMKKLIPHLKKVYKNAPLLKDGELQESTAVAHRSLWHDTTFHALTLWWTLGPGIFSYSTNFLCLFSSFAPCFLLI